METILFTCIHVRTEVYQQVAMNKFLLGNYMQALCWQVIHHRLYIPLSKPTELLTQQTLLAHDPAVLAHLGATRSTVHIHC